ALLYNRKLWTVFLGSAMSDDNPLPGEIRQNVANLGMYIMSQTIAVTSDPKVEIVNSLVSINRELASGLRGQGWAEPSFPLRQGSCAPSRATTLSQSPKAGWRRSRAVGYHR